MLTAINGEIDNKAIIVGDFNIRTVINGQINQTENQGTQSLNDTLD